MAQSEVLVSMTTQQQEIISTQVPQDEEVAGQFTATARPPMALYFIVGAFSSFFTKSYIVTVTDKKVYFTKTNFLTAKTEHTDAFAYDEIEKATLKTGKLLAKFKLKFRNGNKLVLQVPYRAQKPESVGIGPFKKPTPANYAILDESLTLFLKDRLPCNPY